MLHLSLLTVGKKIDAYTVGAVDSVTSVSTSCRWEVLG